MPVETRAYPEMMGNFTRFECAPYGRPGTSAILEGAIPILKYSNIVVLGNHGYQNSISIWISNCRMRLFHAQYMSLLKGC